MPHKSMRPCAWPGCPELVRDGMYCEAHQMRMQQVEHVRGDKRESSTKRGYGYRWQKLRRMVLNEQPLCADPYGLHANSGEIVAATEVDHIIPKSEGGTNEWSNLQGLCKSCHSQKTATQDGGWGRGGSISTASPS